jgi:hypothetical protein
MIKAKLYMNVHWTVFYNLKVFCSDMKFKMAATAGLSLTLDRHKKHIFCRGPSNDHSWAVWFQLFFSETTNMIKAKLYMNVHWTVFYNLKVFCSDMKFKMAATAGFEISANQSILLALAAILNIRLERKTVTL